MNNLPDNVFYQDNAVTVTKTKIVVGSKTFSMANITSVAPYIQQKLILAIICILIALFMFSVGMVSVLLFAGGDLCLCFIFCFIVGAIFFVLGFLLLRPVYWVEIRSSSTEGQKVMSGDKKRVMAIVDAIALAIEARG